MTRYYLANVVIGRRNGGAKGAVTETEHFNQRPRSKIVDAVVHRAAAYIAQEDHRGGSASVEVICHFASFVKKEFGKLVHQQTSAARKSSFRHNGDQVPRLDHSDPAPRIPSVVDAAYVAHVLIDDAVIDQRGAERISIDHTLIQ